MYRQARTNLSDRPWRVDDFDEFAEVFFSKSNLDVEGQGGGVTRGLGFVPNSNPDAEYQGGGVGRSIGVLGWLYSALLCALLRCWGRRRRIICKGGREGSVGGWGRCGACSSRC